MTANELLEEIQILLDEKAPHIKVEEHFVGDEELNQVYFLFNNVKDSGGM
jgi:hypothetical protein